MEQESIFTNLRDAFVLFSVMLLSICITLYVDKLFHLYQQIAASPLLILSSYLINKRKHIRGKFKVGTYHFVINQVDQVDN